MSDESAPSAPAADDRPILGQWDRPLTRLQRVVYTIARLVVYGFAKIYFRVQVQGTSNLPPSGSYIVAPAHRSNLDSVLLQAVTRRQFRFMGKDSLWKVHPAISWFLTAIGGFPVARGTADRASMRLAQEFLEAGEVLVMFPEGTRKSGPEIQPLFDGPAFLASRTGVPIVPVGIGGSEAAMGKGVKIPRPKQICFIIGTPLLPPVPEEGKRPSRRAIQNLTAELHGSVQELFDEAQRQVGQPVGNPPETGQR